MTFHQFSVWLDATALSQLIKATEWLIPAVQSVHIVAVCVVVASALLVDLRLLEFAAKDVPVSSYTRRYLPWLGAAVIVLLLTGLTLIVGEPYRTLENWVFWTKMILLAAGIAVTGAIAIPTLSDRFYWDGTHRRGAAVALGTLSLVVWVGVVICGRWIAYVL